MATSFSAQQTRAVAVMSATSQVVRAVKTSWVMTLSVRQGIFAAEMLALQKKASAARIPTLATSSPS
jgi:hypothetical protein